GRPSGSGNKKKEDGGTNDQVWDVLNCRGVTGNTKLGGKISKRDRQHKNQRSAKKRAGQAAKPADDNHEKNEEAQIDVEHCRLGTAVPEENQQRSCNAAVE